MSQRIMLCLSLCMAIGCLAVAGLTWRLLNDNRAGNAALLARLEVLEQKHAGQAETQTETADTQESTEAAPSIYEWVPVELSFAWDKTEKPPASGITMTLSGELFNTGEAASINKTVDSTGRIDLGRIRPGQHELTIVLPWKESAQRPLLVRSGEPCAETILCPAAEPPRVDVELSVSWSEEFQEADVCMGYLLANLGRLANGLNWQTRSPSVPLVTLLAAPSGRAYWAEGAYLPDQPVPYTGTSILRGYQSDSRRRNASNAEHGGTDIAPKNNRILNVSTASENGKLRLPAGNYRLDGIFVAGRLRPDGDGVTFSYIPLCCGESLKAIYLGPNSPPGYSAHSDAPNHWRFVSADEFAGTVTRWAALEPRLSVLHPLVLKKVFESNFAFELGREPVPGRAPWAGLSDPDKTVQGVLDVFVAGDRDHDGVLTEVELAGLPEAPTRSSAPTRTSGRFGSITTMRVLQLPPKLEPGSLNDQLARELRLGDLVDSPAK